jgi:UDP-GlcNAc:undecaprenyl-phosphate/decaprenyl-phosphate GlcNAc-1-phosphate transferase
MGTVYLVSFIAALLVSLILTRAVRNLAVRRGWVPALSAHHIHRQPVPRLGGIAIFITVVLVAGLAKLTLLWLNLPIGATPRVMRPLLIPALLIFALGLYDDLKPLSARVKFGVQAVAAMLLYWSGFGKFDLLTKLGLPGAEWMALPLTIFFVLFVTNAFNLIDGLDGLAAGSSLFSTVTMLIVALLNGHHLVAVLTIVMAGATLGFLRYNFNPATIFLGDSGSLFLGFLLAALALESSEKMPTIVAVALPIVLFGLPLAETSLSVARRFLSGRPLFSADREHIHHKLLERGLTQRQAVIMLYGVSAVCGLLTLLLLRRESSSILIVWLSLAALIWVGVKRLGYLEFHELGRAAHRAIEQKRLISNNLILRRSTRQLTEACTRLEVFGILQQAFEASNFDGYQLTLNYAAAPPGWLLEDEPQAARQRFAWYRPAGSDLGTSCRTYEWTLTLEMETSNHESCGQLSLYRRRSDQELFIDLNLLTTEFKSALADALARVTWQPVHLESDTLTTVVSILRDERVSRFGFETV